jgi:hypothetical protein
MTNYFSDHDCDSRETSREVLLAISVFARDEADAVRIWEAPTNAEVVQIKAIVVAAGLEPEELFWGSEGVRWSSCDSSTAEELPDNA